MRLGQKLEDGQDVLSEGQGRRLGKSMRKCSEERASHTGLLPLGEGEMGVRNRHPFPWGIQAWTPGPGAAH